MRPASRWRACPPISRGSCSKHSAEVKVDARRTNDVERTLLILKPDTVERKLVGKILAMVEADGFRLVRLNLVGLTSDRARSFYAEHEGKPFLKDLVDYLTNGPCIPLLLEAD